MKILLLLMLAHAYLLNGIFPQMVQEHGFLFVLATVMGLVYYPVMCDTLESGVQCAIASALPFLFYWHDNACLPYVFVLAFAIAPVTFLFIGLMGTGTFRILVELWVMPISIITLVFHATGVYGRWVAMGNYGFLKIALLLFAGFYILWTGGVAVAKGRKGTKSADNA